MTRETIQMLEKLTWSQNKQTACQAAKILTFAISEEDAMNYAGGFLYAILTGNRKEALERADMYNFIALGNDKTEMNLNAED